MTTSPVDLLFIGNKPTWKSPTTISFNRLPARATLLPFADATGARTLSREKTPYFQSLNGEWDFTLLHRPEEVRTEMLLPGFDFNGAGFPKNSGAEQLDASGHFRQAALHERPDALSARAARSAG